VKYRSFSTYFLLSSVIDVLAITLPLPMMAQAFGADAAQRVGVVEHARGAHEDHAGRAAWQRAWQAS
jgi:hypothetical protein